MAHVFRRTSDAYHANLNEGVVIFRHNPRRVEHGDGCVLIQGFVRLLIPHPAVQPLVVEPVIDLNKEHVMGHGPTQQTHADLPDQRDE